MALSKIETNSLDVGQVGGRRNLLINGNFQIWQRGTSFTATEDADIFVADRWRYRESTDDNGTVTVSQSTDTPHGYGYSMKLTSTASDTNGVSGTEYSRFQYNIEGQDVAHVFTGNSNAKPLTISFWVKCAKAGNLSVGLELPVTNYRNIVKSFTIDQADTWEYKTITFPANTARAVTNWNGFGLRITFCVANSATSWKGLSEGVWSTNNTYYQGLTSDMNVFQGTTGDVFFLSQVQLEVGSVATPFEHRSYGEELALCQRYYQYMAVNGSGQRPFQGYLENTTAGRFDFPLTTTLRAEPTVTRTSGITVYMGGSNLGWSTLYWRSAVGTAFGHFYVTTSTGGTQYYGVHLRFNDTSDRLSLDAEL